MRQSCATIVIGYSPGLPIMRGQDVYRLQLIILFFMFGSFAVAQEPDAEDDAAAPADEAAAEIEDEVSEVSDEEIDALLGIGEEDYADSEDDDFDPTESVRFEQSIPFPVDI